MEKPTQDRWVPIPGYEGTYEISERGSVRSLTRIVAVPPGRSRRAHGRVLAVHIDKRGYPGVNLWRDGKGKFVLIHRLLLLAFVRPPESGEECRHLDGNPANHSLDNLAWGTPSQNILDQVRHGTHNHSSATHCPRGHPYDEANTRIYQGRRFCIACERARKKRPKT